MAVYTKQNRVPVTRFYFLLLNLLIRSNKDLNIRLIEMKNILNVENFIIL